MEYSEADEEGESNASIKISDKANGDDFTEGTSREQQILIIIIIYNISIERRQVVDEVQ